MRRDTWCGSIWEAFWAHARSSYPLPFWFSDGQRYVMCRRCGFFGSTRDFVEWGGSGLAAYTGYCRACFLEQPGGIMKNCN